MVVVAVRKDRRAAAQLRGDFEKWAYSLDATQHYKWGLNLVSLLRVVVNVYRV